MKVLLINPPLENLLSVGVESFTGTRGFFPSIGLLYVAAYARQSPDFEVEVLDCPLEGAGYDRLDHEIRSRAPDVVGISVLTFTLIDAIRTARLVKMISNRIMVVFGGFHVSLYPRETIAIPEVDFAVPGEGERVFAALLNCINQNGRLNQVKGILFKTRGMAVDTGAAQTIESLDALPFPARDLTPYQNFYSLKNKTLSTSMITGRGCPYRCIFCVRSRFFDRFRMRSAANVIAEIKSCLKLGIREFHFWDDTFTLHRERTVEFCRRLQEERLDIKWSVMTRVDKVDPDLLRMMKQAGCMRIRYGNESGNDDILARLKKGISSEQIRRAFQWTRLERIPTVSYFMIGSPGETREQIVETLRLAKQLNASFTNFSIVTLYPGTELYEMALKRGIIDHDCWRDFSENPNPGFQPPVWEEKFSRAELIGLQKKMFRRYYLRPAFMIKKLLEISSWRGFRETVINALRLVGFRGKRP